VLTVKALPVEGGKFRLYYPSSRSVKPAVCGLHLGRGNALPFPEFRDYFNHAEVVKDAGRLQAYIDREHKTQFAE
jgi:hypothetical protein